MSELSNFQIAMKVVLHWEGGWVNNPDDPGGETIFGISRIHHPGWAGWTTVDAAKANPDFSAELMDNTGLRQLAVDFYEQNFWKQVHGDELPPQLALLVFDMAVHSGPLVAMRQLQVTLAVLVDGVCGPKTIKAAWDAGRAAVYEFVYLRVLHYVDLILDHPEKRPWASNFIKRIIYLAAVAFNDVPPG